jgi:putative tricarboxylic transport membrane protein
MLEQNLRQALIISKGDLGVFLTRPISAVCLIISLLLLLSGVSPAVQRKRRVVASEE